MLNLRDSLQNQSDIDTAFALIAACPICQVPLSVESDDSFKCRVCGRLYRRENGIWRFLTAEQQIHYAPFLGVYGDVRSGDGWERSDDAYYLKLPNVADDDPQSAIWRMRRRSFNILRRSLPSRPQTWALDLGAGNCWLSRHLAAIGYRVLALDIRAASRDGLENGSLYLKNSGVSFVRGQAGANTLPIIENQISLCVISGAFHYLNLEQTLQNVFRILVPGSKLIVMDSPVYGDENSGMQMMQEQLMRFKAQYGIEHIPVEGKGYLVLNETVVAFDKTGFQTSVRWLERPGAWVKRLLPRQRTVHRQLARFPLFVGIKPTPIRTAGQ
ncbi:MAG: methyltransferase domain-containing protein [Aggregatilineales bacterium]